MYKKKANTGDHVIIAIIDNDDGDHAIIAIIAIIILFDVFFVFVSPFSLWSRHHQSELGSRGGPALKRADEMHDVSLGASRPEKPGVTFL